MIIFDTLKISESWMDRYDDLLAYLRKTAKSKYGSGEAFALALGHSASWWSNIVNNKRGLNIEGLYEIAKLLGVTPGSLLQGGAENRPGLDLNEYIKAIVRDEVVRILDEIKK